MATRRTPLQVAEAADKKGNLAKAVEAYLEHLETHPEDARILLRVGELSERSGNPAVAVDAFKKLGEHQLAAGFAAKAVSVLRRAFKLFPEDASAAVLLGRALASEGRKRDAAEVLESAAKAAELRGEKADQIRLLRTAAELDGSARTSLALADVLAEGETKAAALKVLKSVAARLKDENALADQVRVQERMLELSVDDAEVGLEAAAGALALREPTRSLLIVRKALDGHPNDVRLIQAAAVGLEAFGDRSRAARVFRECARIHSRSGEERKAHDCWASVLRLAPDDAEAKRVVAPFALPETEANEVEDVFADLPEERERRAAEDVTFEVDLESIDRAEMEVDQVPPQTPPKFLALPDELLDVDFEDDNERSRPPPPLPSKAKTSHTHPKPQRALVLGYDAEAAWACSGLAELGIDILTLGLDELGGAVERALQTRRDLIIAPGPLQEGLAQAGRDWRVAGPVFLERDKAANLARAAKLPVVEARPVRTAADLESAFSTWGAPLELQGSYGKTIKLASPVGAAFQLALARQQLGAELFVQRFLPDRVWVLLAADGTGVKALGEFSATLVEGVPGFVSDESEGEKERLALAVQLGTAMGLKGTAVLSLAGAAGTYAFDSFLPRWGPGALAIEVRLGVSLITLAVDLARGLSVPPRLEARGAACAVEVQHATLSSVANLRVETGQDGVAYACAQGPDADQASRKLARVLKPAARRT